MTDKFMRYVLRTAKRLVDMNDGSHAELVVAKPPIELLSDDGGPSMRLRVDPGQTGFFAGKMFRAYVEAVIPTAGPAVSFRFTCPKDFILWSQSLDLTQGALRFEVFTGAVSAGSWVQRPVIGVNRMVSRPAPYYAPTATFETGGTFTGGMAVDLMLLRASAANNNANNVGGDVSERGLPAGIYHGRFTTLAGGLTVNDAAQMVYSILWEER